MTQNLIVALSGASGQIYGIRLLEILNKTSTIKTHLVMSAAAGITIAQETDYTVKQVEALADEVYRPADIGAAIASGSFETMGMIIVPCSIKTLSSIANSYDADLTTRAADVQLKEGRPVLLAVREAPLHLGHLRLMTQAAEIGCIIFPPVPAFYTQPKSIADIVDNTCGRMLARIGVPNEMYERWMGVGRRSEVGRQRSEDRGQRSEAGGRGTVSKRTTAKPSSRKKTTSRKRSAKTPTKPETSTDDGWTTEL